MKPSDLSPEDRVIYASWIHYHNVVKGRNYTIEDFANRRTYNRSGKKCDRSRKSKYGPQDRFDEGEMARHRQHCIRNGWTPYPEYLVKVKEWYDRQKMVRTPKESPRQKAERILREKGLAPRGMAA